MKKIIGNIDNFSSKGIWGWCRSTDSNESLVISAKINNLKSLTMKADLFRPDLKRSDTNSEGKFGFNFQFPSELTTDKEFEFKIIYDGTNQVILNSPVFLNSHVKKDKIFFLHIPKAAGTSFNEMLTQYFIKSNYQFHIEGDRDNMYQNIDTQKLSMFSGHIRLYEAVQYLSFPNFLRVTVVRDPLKQLISHINWVKHISENPYGPFFLSHPKHIRDLSLQIRKIDFSSSKSIELFLKNLPDIGKRLFNNCQTRYLLNEIDPSSLDLNHANRAIKTLSFFDIIGTLEKFDEFTEKIQKRMAWDKPIKIIKTNALDNKYGLDSKSEDLKEILKPLITVDQIVYDHIVTMGN